MEAKGILYALVSRSKNTILSSQTQFMGNFPTVSLDIMEKVDMSKKFSQFATLNFSFFVFCEQGYLFLAMTDLEYEARISINFLKTIQTKFFNMYNEHKRSTALAFSLKSFNKVLRQTMDQFSDKTKVDKLAELSSHLTQLEQIALQNLQKVIERTQKIQLAVKKSQALSLQSYDIHRTSQQVERAMWWQNKKVIIGISVTVAVVLITLIVVLVILLK